jgi:hypothetical protein
MRLLIAAIAGGIFCIAIALGGFFIGKQQCPGCHEIDRVELLAGVLSPAQKLVLTESNDQLRVEWALVSTWPRLAALVSRFGPAEKARGFLQYDVRFGVGYDMRQRATWSLRREGAKIVFDAPALQVIGCPAVLTQTLKFVVQQDAILVDEAGREREIVAFATAQALAAAHNKLRSRAAEIEKLADVELKSFLASMAQPLGINSADIEIRVPRKPVDVPPAWTPRADAGGNLDAESMRQMKAAGCAAAGA